VAKRADPRAWIKDNPVLALVIGLGGLFFIVLVVVIAALLRGGGPSKAQIDAVASEADICKRLHKLNELDTDKKNKGFSAEYVLALKAAYRDLTKIEPTTDDALALAGLSSECTGLSGPDFAWLAIADTRFKKGEWPSWPEEPPSNEAVRGRLHDAITHYPRLQIAIPADAELRSKWLRFAVEDPEYAKNPQAPIGPLLAVFYKADDTQTAHLALYQQLAQMPGGVAWLSRKLYDRLNLLPEPLYVTDTVPETSPPGLQRGPDYTLRFLGVLEGDRCAIALDPSPLPPLWVRSCKGLLPRRFASGELFLLSAEAKVDVDYPLHWLPLLVEESGDVRFGDSLRGKLDDRVLAAFMVAAPRFVLAPKGLIPFSPTPNVTSARQGEGGASFASFRTAVSGGFRPRVLAFSPHAKVKLDRSCPKVNKARCEPIKGQGEHDTCELGAPLCMTLGGAAMVRSTPVRVVRPVPCIKEYGEKTVCKAHEIVGLFVDTIAEGANEYTDGPFIALYEKKPEE
jgi:hypothetical protein